jgi:hypothetical protein
VGEVRGDGQVKKLESILSFSPDVTIL